MQMLNRYAMIPIRSGIFFARASRILEGLATCWGLVEPGKGIGCAPRRARGDLIQLGGN
jgi:hypothetical protein